MVSSPTRDSDVAGDEIKTKEHQSNKKYLDKEYQHQNIHPDKCSYMNQECWYILLSRGIC